MTKFFISGQGTGGTLAIEKFLNAYFHENYFYALVSEEKLPQIIDDLSAVQGRYFEIHKGKRVNIGFATSYNDERLYLNIGDLSYTFVKIQKEIL